MSAKDMEHGWLTVAEAARYAQVSEQMIRGAIFSGALAAYIHPESKGTQRRNLRVSRRGIDAWIENTWEPVVA